EAQRAKLQDIARHAAANGVDDLVLLSRDEARAMEPALECVAALHSPSTGIVDSHGLMLSLQGDLENAGGMVVFNSPLAAARCEGGHILLRTEDVTELQARTVVNAAGLWAPDLARKFEGADGSQLPIAHYAKGNYFTLSGRAPFKQLIYPVPEVGGLGVHLTLDLGGQAKFGPDVQWVASAEDLMVDPARGDAFYAAVRRYWPGLQDGALAAGYAGIRPKISGPGEPDADFVLHGPEVHGAPGLFHLLGIESPGLTSCLAIAKAVHQAVAQQAG
ncbi:MAG: FAD-dependent oxidoreductase, partial [Comamonas sp.]|nr:FAD-dependent oxidoreductase [Comamonas sp.]